MPNHIAKDIVDFLQPGQKRLPSAQRSLEDSVQELCDKAYDLSVLLRKSRGVTFKVIKLPYGFRITEKTEDQVSLQRYVGRLPQDILGSEVEFTVFGSLTKHLDDSSEPIILEKAQVVCRA